MTVRARLKQVNQLPYDPKRCSGCGITLQSANIDSPGYAYTSKLATADRRRDWVKKMTYNKIFDDAIENLDVELVAKLANARKVVKEPEEGKYQDFGRSEEDDEIFLEDEFLDSEVDAEQGQHERRERKAEYGDKMTTAFSELRVRRRPAPTIDSKRPKLCRRCHLVTYHSNPLNNTRLKLPIPQKINAILHEISATNRDPENPPLIIHVIDVVDFPLSFIPFNVPGSAKVMFVINRADSLCERSSSMAHVRTYFERQLPFTLKDAGVDLGRYEVHPVSARKGWGVKALLDRIFEIRKAESNVYLIGTRLLAMYINGRTYKCWSVVNRRIPVRSKRNFKDDTSSERLPISFSYRFGISTYNCRICKSPPHRTQKPQGQNKREYL
jgi:hypothetical protein